MKFLLLRSAVKSGALLSGNGAMKADSSVGIFSLIEIPYITVIPSVLQESTHFV